MRGLVAVILAIMTGMFCSVVTYLPEIGDANTAPNQHVTPTYISRSAEDTGSPNIVTGDHRLSWLRYYVGNLGNVPRRSDNGAGADQQSGRTQT